MSVGRPVTENRVIKSKKRKRKRSYIDSVHLDSETKVFSIKSKQGGQETLGQFQKSKTKSKLANKKQSKSNV